MRWRLAIVGLLGLLSGLASAAGVLEHLELQVVDAFFRLRHHSQADPPLDDRIVVIRLDGEVFSEIGQPVSRWSDDYALVLDKLFEGGASVVGLDVTYHPNLDKLPWDQASIISDEITELAFRLLEREVVIVDTMRPRRPDLQSIDVIHTTAAERDNVGYNNVHTDDDGVVRQLSLFFFETPPRANRNFVGRLDRALTGETATLNSDGSVQGWVTEPGPTLRINYPGPPDSTFPSLKMSELLNGPPPDVQGKLCLIGPADDAFNDLHETPLGKMLGVEVHASALNTVLTKSFLRRSPGWAHLVLCLGGCLLATTVAARASTAPLVLAALGVGLGYPVVCYLTFLKGGLILPLVGPLLVTVLCGAGTHIARSQETENSRRYITSVLGRFVSPQVMQELLADPDNLQLGGRRRRITVLFADINNFTPLCEKKTPEEVISMLNDFFEEMLEIIFRYGGTVKQFVGDEIMVLYGAPDQMPDHAARAVLTARAMVERLQELKGKRGEETGFYDIKIGIHTGEAVVGNVGNEKRSEYAAVGDSVNTAARIEAMTKDLGVAILVSEETRRECEETLSDITFASQGKKSFKGKKDKLEVFTVDWRVSP